MALAQISAFSKYSSTRKINSLAVHLSPKFCASGLGGAEEGMKFLTFSSVQGEDSVIWRKLRRSQPLQTLHCGLQLLDQLLTERLTILYLVKPNQDKTQRTYLQTVLCEKANVIWWSRPCSGRHRHEQRQWVTEKLPSPITPATLIHIAAVI